MYTLLTTLMTATNIDTLEIRHTYNIDMVIPTYGLSVPIIPITDKY